MGLRPVFWEGRAAALDSPIGLRTCVIGDVIEVLVDELEKGEVVGVGLKYRGEVLEGPGRALDHEEELVLELLDEQFLEDVTVFVKCLHTVGVVNKETEEAFPVNRRDLESEELLEP